MKNQLLLFAALGLASFVACAITDESETATRESALGACVGDKLRFDDFAGVTACQKDNPPMVVIAINAVVAGGGTCTATDRNGVCTSLDPVRDDTTARMIGNPFDCMTFWSKGAQQMTCCNLDQFGGFDSDRCFTAPYTLEGY